MVSHCVGLVQMLLVMMMFRSRHGGYEMLQCVTKSVMALCKRPHLCGHSDIPVLCGHNHATVQCVMEPVCALCKCSSTKRIFVCMVIICEIPIQCRCRQHQSHEVSDCSVLSCQCKCCCHAQALSSLSLQSRDTGTSTKRNTGSMYTAIPDAVPLKVLLRSSGAVFDNS